jgi:menaquinone-specific isochorismate synthase
MEIIDIPLEDKADPEGLKVFLEACRESAATDNHDKVASISLGVRHIDPLAVLDSIYEGEAHHFYMENPRREWAVAGAEAVVSGSWDGPGRFREAKAFAAEMDQHVIAIGDMGLPFSGPLFFSGFAFPDGIDGAGAFPSSLVFIPQWQVARSGDQYVAVANALIRPDSDVERIAERIWSAHRKFVTFNYDQPPQAPVYHITSEHEVGPEGAFARNVETALQRIEAGAYEKIVISRALDLEFDNPCQPLKILNRLRQDFPLCNSFSLQHQNGASFIGSTPERLVTVRDGRFATEAIAGSAPRGPDAGVDARLARELLSSEKDLREHRHVVDSICRRLALIGLEADAGPLPGLLVLHNVQHLRTPLEGALPDGMHILDLAESLHPTPAVGGTPREAALKDIAELEPFPRGMFAGLTGWFDTRGNGEFAVGIRSALVQGPSARLYAGAGIVRGSIPGDELRETTMKMEALLRCIRGAAG